MYVHQDGTNPWINLSRPEIISSLTGKEGSVTINSNVNWVALHDADWLHLETPFGVEIDDLQFTIAENDTGEYRSTVIEVYGAGISKIITVTQLATELPESIHTVTISNGGIGASANPTIAEAGQTVTISSGRAPSGYAFAGWTSNQNVVFAHANLTTTTFTMIDEPVTVIANWREITVAIQYDELSVSLGRTLQFGELVTDPEFCSLIWEVEGHTSPYTFIDNTGLLFVGLDETSATLTVRLRLAALPSVYDVVTLDVIMLCYSCGNEKDPNWDFCIHCMGTR